MMKRCSGSTLEYSRTRRVLASAAKSEDERSPIAFCLTKNDQLQHHQCDQSLVTVLEKRETEQ